MPHFAPVEGPVLLIVSPQTTLRRQVTPVEKAKFMIQERLVVNSPEGICKPRQERGNHIWTVPDISVIARNMSSEKRTCMDCVLPEEYIHTVCFPRYLDEVGEAARLKLVFSFYFYRRNFWTSW